MQIADVREALTSLPATTGLDWGDVLPIEGGWSYWTFLVEPDCIFRFPRREEIADELRKEIRLLPELGANVSFAVPQFEWTGRHAGMPFAGYRRLAGRALLAADLAMNGSGPSQTRANARERVAQMLAELHGFPKRRASEILQIRDAIAAWTDRYQALRIEVEDRVLEHLPAGLRESVLRATDRFQTEGLSYFSHPVLVHCDLGSEHLLVDDATGLCFGIIDFADATVGDPVIDFVGLLNTHGKEVTGDVLARYGGPHDAGFGERLHFYQWMGSVHAILHGLKSEDDALVRDAIAELDRRIQRSAFGDPLQL